MCYRLLFLLILIISGCAEPENKKNAEFAELTDSALLVKGDSISIQAQKTLVQQVMGAIQSGGTAYAVEFCNTHALKLTDSLSAQSNVTIQRISEKYRNPKNGIFMAPDSMAIIEVRRLLNAKEHPAHVLYGTPNSNKIVYYKPIKIGMPACLSCHGDPGKDISAETLRIINAKYPADKATGYKEGDLRGFWKITISDTDYR